MHKSTFIKIDERNKSEIIYPIDQKYFKKYFYVFIEH